MTNRNVRFIPCDCHMCACACTCPWYPSMTLLTLSQAKAVKTGEKVALKIIKIKPGMYVCLLYSCPGFHREGGWHWDFHTPPPPPPPQEKFSLPRF